MLVPRFASALALCALALAAVRASAGEALSVPATATTPQLPAYVARPASAAPAPGVVVLHGCEGYRAHYGAVADWLASHGYVGVAIDTLTPRGVTNACTDRSGSRIEARDALAALAWMRRQPYIDPARLAVLGYSMGAIATLDIVDPHSGVAAPPGVRAGIAYYPACRNRIAANVNAPLRILDGDADTWTPAPPCQTLAQAATAAGKTVVITTYPGATHAFNVKGPDRTAYGHALRYDASAAADAQTQTLRFLSAAFRN
jgi:dienelactone hydrolase